MQNSIKKILEWITLKIKGRCWPLFALLLALLFVRATFYVNNVLFWLSFLVAALLADYAIKGLFQPKATKSKKSKYLPSKAALIVLSTLFTLTVLDGALVVMAHLVKPQQQLVMPKEWEMRDVKVPGAARAYYWHNILHVFDKHGFRRAEPFTAKKEGVYRILIVGDSLTYGQAIENSKTYPSLIEKRLQKQGYNVEVINLGAMGRQSEDMLNNVKKFFDILQPDLVVYGICVNDFLPSEKGEYSDRTEFSIPLPASVKSYFLTHSKFIQFLNEQYGKVLRKFNLRIDFFTDILKDFDGYRTRFASDLQEMNKFVKNKGLPPVIAIVLNQFPATSGVAFETTNYAEEYAKEAGMIVIPSLPYNKKYEGEKLYVSEWDGHPNERAHDIFAKLLLPTIEKEIKD